MSGYNNMADKFDKFIREHIVDFALVIACVAYVVQGLVQISETGKSVAQIVGDGIISLIFGYVISRTLNIKGVMSGLSSEIYKGTMAAYAEIIELVTPFIDKLGDWCLARNDDEKKRIQTNTLLLAGIKYENFINNTLDKTKLDERQKKIIKKAEGVKFKELTTTMLTSENDNEVDEPFDFGRTLNEYTKISSTTDLFTKIACAVTFGYYGAGFVQNFSYTALIWRITQVATFLILGGLKYLNSRMFVTNGLRNRFIQKTNTLYEFYNTMKESKNNDSIGFKTTESDAKQAGCVLNAGREATETTKATTTVNATEIRVADTVTDGTAETAT